MGRDPNREEPFFFMKPADAIVREGTDVPYPPLTADLHHEIELVLAIGRAGHGIAPDRAAEYVYGVAVGVDLTRRDLQIKARDAGRPWEIGKSFDNSALCGAIHPLTSGRRLPSSGEISLKVNETIRQKGDLAEMIWQPEEIIGHLSRSATLKEGDLIFTGTPAGVGPLVRGDRIEGSIESIGHIRFSIV
jgi:fumarylpyruvate hydrolase